MRFKGRTKKKIAPKEGQEEVFDQKLYLETIMSSMTDSLIVVNPDATLRSVNKAALDLLGYKEDELIGQPMEKIFLQEEEEEEEEENILHKYFQKIIVTGVAYNIGLTFLTKQGKEIPVDFSGALMQQDGKIIGIVGVARDMRQIMAVISDLKKRGRELEERSKNLTRMQRAMLHMMGDLDIAKKEMEKAEKELKKLDQLKTDFISTVSHELRTPLAITKEGISLILDKIPGEINEKQEKILSTARSNIDRLARIIDDLLDVSKIEAGKVELKRELVDIAGLIRQAAFSFELNLKEKNLELKINVPEKQIDAFVDPDKLTQVLTNLIGNALKFTDRGYIEISLQEKEKEIACIVADTGLGISEEDLPKVFSKFEQFGRLPGPGEKGTGLGLAITKGIIELYGGKIWVESKLGQGTKFTFTLPKYGPKEVLYENIEERIAQAQKEQIGFSVLLIRLDNYSEIKKVLGKGGLKKDILKIFEIVENTIRIGDFAIVIDETVIIILVGADSRGALKINTRLKRAIKETIFEIDEELKVNFSYGYSVYPNDGGRPEDLLAKAQKSLVSESEERLTKNIMVVDDEPMVTEVLKKLLEKVGYSNFIEVHDGEQALQKIKNKAPDLLILDMKMPNMSGYEVIGRLKENIETKDIPILIVSAYEVEIDKLKEYIKKKAIPVLGKPIDMGQLEKLVNYLL